jgi:hypothetical protein
MANFSQLAEKSSFNRRTSPREASPRGIILTHDMASNSAAIAPLLKADSLRAQRGGGCGGSIAEKKISAYLLDRAAPPC